VRCLRFIWLAAIFILVWAGLLLLFYFIKLVVMVPVQAQSSFGHVAIGTGRVVAGIALALLWLYAWKKIGEFYLWSRLGRRKP